MAQENRANPYDFVVQLHNQILEESLKLGNKSTNEIPETVENIALANADFANRCPNYSKNAELVKGIIKTGINDYNNNFRNAISQLNISSDAKVYSQKLVDYMFAGGISSNPPTYEDFNTFVINLEQEVTSNSKLTELDKQTILCGTSTARYSGAFWSRQQGDAAARRPWWNWLVIGVCDVGGAIAGAAVNPGVAVTAGAAASVAANTLTNPSNK